MIRLEAIPKELRRRLPKMEASAAIEILTYKRNRGLIITLRGGRDLPHSRTWLPP